MDGWFCVSQESCREAYSALRRLSGFLFRAPPSAPGRCFFLDKTYHGWTYSLNVKSREERMVYKKLNSTGR